MIILKQATASQEVPLGPFLDQTDGFTPETALTINNTDIKIWKSGATSNVSKNSGGATHIATGIYYAVLDATDTDTLGPMKLFVILTGTARPVELECLVVTANVYDSLIAGTDTLDVNASTVADKTGYTAATVSDKTGYALSAGGNSAVADQVWDELRSGHVVLGSFGQSAQGVVREGTAQAGGASTITLDAAASGTDDAYTGLWIAILSGTGSGQIRKISGYVGATKVATVPDAWATQPTSSSIFGIFS